MIKRFTTPFMVLAMAVFALATLDIRPADAHKLRLFHNHGGFSVGIGSGIAGGIYLGTRKARRRHCHGNSFCHKHSNRGYHSHNKRGLKVYPRSTAPRNRRTFTYNAHVRWCVNRYRTYSVRTDTFQPYHGPRKRCRSPF